MDNFKGLLAVVIDNLAALLFYTETVLHYLEDGLLSHQKSVITIGCILKIETNFLLLEKHFLLLLAKIMLD